MGWFFDWLLVERKPKPFDALHLIYMGLSIPPHSKFIYLPHAEARGFKSKI